MNQPQRADRIRVLETIILHGSDVLYWLDGTSAENTADMQRIAYPLQVVFTEKPGNISIVNSSGKTALNAPAMDTTVPGPATEAQRARPLMPSFSVKGEVHDPLGRFNPRAFSATLGAGTGVAVPMYPTPSATKPSAGGLLYGCLKFADSGRPASWALLELTVTISGGATLIFRAQADGKGEFRSSLLRLPPLPESIPAYSGSLRVRADSSADSNTTADLNDFAAMELESTSSTGGFLPELNIPIHPGDITRISSFGKNHISIQPA